MSVLWNPWHGCTKVSAGCQNCYVYRRDEMIGKDASIVSLTKNFHAPIEKNRHGAYKMMPDDHLVFTCFSSDFFHPDADQWRKEAWQMIKERSDLHFFFVTKRPQRFYENLPDDWNGGYENVHIACTCENQKEADHRLPIFLSLPIIHKEIIHEPMLEQIDLTSYLSQYAHKIDVISCGGESGPQARICDYNWVLHTRKQCMEYGVAFSYHQTGYRLRKDNKVYTIPRKAQHTQAKKANIDYTPK